MNTTTCTRCGGTGFFGPLTVAQGRCFGCNRGHVPALATRGLTRERIITTLAGLLAAAKRAAAAGDYAGWLAAVTGDEACPSLPGLLGVAPADVRARFEAALSQAVGL